MPATSAPLNPAPASPAARSAGAWRRCGTAAAVLLMLSSAWWLGQMTPLRASSDTGYWLGVAGGVLMLALFAYPLRKRLRSLRHLGSTRGWFVVHMVLGIGGPWLILVHCGLRIGSLNAAVALFSMLIVAASGVIGRFIYVRVHHGLSGRKAELGEAQAALQADERQINDRLASLPEVCATLLDFQRAAMATSKQGRLSRTLWLSWQARVVRQRVHGQLHAVLMKTPPSGRSALLRSWLIQTDGHLARVLKVAQFSAWERLFALWHVLHVPFVWVMVVCALAHVVAVHAY